MTDTTYMRCYGNKQVYSGGGFLGGNGTFGILTASSANISGEIVAGDIWANGTINSSNAISAIGYQTSGSGDYGFINGLGHIGTGSGTVQYSLYAKYRVLCTECDCTSDSRQKSEIAPFADTLCADYVSRIHQKHFKHDADSGRYKVGFVAQDIDEVFPNAVTKYPREVEGGVIDDYHMLSYNQMCAVLWGAVRALQKDVAELRRAK
jgi:hypothetical protein